MATIVKTGVYFGFTQEELDVELIRYKEAVKNSGSEVSTESIGAETFSYGPRRDLSLQEWQVELQAAMYQLDPASVVLERDRASVDLSR